MSYGTAATEDVEGSSRLPLLKLFGRLALWYVLPNRRSAHCYNFRAGRRRRATRFHARQQEAFSAVLRLVETGALQPQIAARFPLSRVGDALRLAQTRTTAGKVILTATA